jgi:hypothetical protein
LHVGRMERASRALLDRDAIALLANLTLKCNADASYRH